MESSNENRQSVIMLYFHSAFIQPVQVDTGEMEIINKFLARLYMDLGSFNWITSAFTTSLDAYGKMRNATREIAMEYEGEIGPQMRQIVMARQFVRASADVVKNYVVENTVDIARYWHADYDAYPPLNIEDMSEPFRRFFLLVNDLLAEMDQRGDPGKAATFLASLMAAFAMTYPARYLDANPDFQKYVKNDDFDEPMDDHYSVYLCYCMDYMLFDRF